MRRAIVDSFRKLDPRHQMRNPVMFTVFVGSILTTVLWRPGARAASGEAPAGFILGVSLWLWFTVLFANFAEAMAEGRGKAQADALRERAHATCTAKKLAEPRPRRARRRRCRRATLRKGDVVLVEAGDIIPGDGEVDRRRRLGRRKRDHRRKRAGHPRKRRRPQQRHRRHARAVRLAHRAHHAPIPARTFLDRMIAMVEGAKRQKTPNEIALDILLAALTIIFLLALRHAAAVLDLQRRSGRARAARSR